MITWHELDSGESDALDGRWERAIGDALTCALDGGAQARGAAAA